MLSMIFLLLCVLGKTVIILKLVEKNTYQGSTFSESDLMVFCIKIRVLFCSPCYTSNKLPKIPVISAA